jgi:GT2 family glycosyltransferase
MGVFYQIPSGVSKISLQGHPVLTTTQGGKIVIDRLILALWQYAGGRELEEIVAAYQAREVEPWIVRSALACLAEAGLLERKNEAPAPPDVRPASGEPVSAVIVSFNSKAWLANCIQSILAQSYSSIEIIVVDNASSDDTVDWIKDKFPSVELLQLEHAQSLAYAINSGIQNASGKYFLLLNPDVELEPHAVANLVAVAQEDPGCAAVAAKLKFLWAPAFLNGLGNFVGAFHWGTDLALGHLDLGQYDNFTEVPSACFAAALISRSAWADVGCLDKNLPLYYEDTEWCYRARLLGYHVRAAPQAVIFHAFSSRVPTGQEGGLSARKLQHVAYGRLHFITKILGPAFFLRFMLSYLLEDFLSALLALFAGRWPNVRAYFRAWRNYVRALPHLRKERVALQSRRACSDPRLFSLQRNIPVPLVWHGLPLLTWDLVHHYYYPLFASNRTRRMPEFSGRSGYQFPETRVPSPNGSYFRAIAILRAEGLGALAHRIWKQIQGYLMKP